MPHQTRQQYHIKFWCVLQILCTHIYEFKLQCLRHTNWTAAWSKGMTDCYWMYHFDYQLWRLICMPLLFFSCFVANAHFKCERNVSSLFFHWSKDPSLDHWEGKQQVSHMKKKGFGSSSCTVPRPVSSFSNFSLTPRSALYFSFHKSHS